MRRLGWVVLLASLPLAAQDFGGSGGSATEQPPRLQEANAALAAQDYPRALKLLKPLAEEQPHNAHLLYDLGVAQDALDQGSGAETSYRSAIEDDAGFLEPRVALGLLLARGGKLEEARTALVGAVAITNTDLVAEKDKPTRARALRALARIDEKQRPGDARNELLAALAISPETPEDMVLTAELAEGAGNGQAPAESAYRRVLAEQPNDAAASAGLAHLLAQQKRYEEAEKLLTGSLGAHAGDQALTIELASVLSAEGKHREALPLIERLHASDPGEGAVTRLLAELYVDAGEYAKAEPLLATLTAQTPRDGGLADLRAQALLHLHRPAEAQQVLAQVVVDPANFSGTPAWGEAAADMAFAASQNDQPAVVLQVLQNRAKVLPPSPPILFLTAISEDKLHHVRNAVQGYKDFLAASNGANPNEEFEARHRLVALDHVK